MITPHDPIPTDELKRALRNLYDPARLRKSPCAAYLGLPPGDETVGGLRRKLVEAIQSLKPQGHIPQSSKAWRMYHVLTYRYIEQMTQKQVAADMGLGIRQLRRLEGDALEALGRILAVRKAPGVVQPPPALDGERPSGTQQELDWLKQTTPCETFEIVPLIENILHTVTPLLVNLGTEVSFNTQPGLPALYGQSASIRQALMSLLAAIGQCAPGGKLSINIDTCDPLIRVEVEATLSGEVNREGRKKLAEAVDLARRLLALSGGEVETGLTETRKNYLVLRLNLPATGEIIILGLDDNLDALHLMERYLAGSCYRLVAIQEPDRLVQTALTLRPKLIILDVMLPGVDGWELLGRLREHPDLGGIPVLVSTILPQESLALALGAAGFLRKPYNQERLLQTIDRLLSGANRFNS